MKLTVVALAALACVAQASFVMKASDVVRGSFGTELARHLAASPKSSVSDMFNVAAKALKTYLGPRPERSAGPPPDREFWSACGLVVGSA